jgi:hypothetical protein
MDAMLATIVDGEQVIVGIDREASRNKLISCLIFTFMLNPLTAAMSNPFRRGSWGWGVFYHRNHAAGEAKGSIMVGMFVCCVFCWQKSFQAGVFCFRRNRLRCKAVN